MRRSLITGIIVLGLAGMASAHPRPWHWWWGVTWGPWWGSWAWAAPYPAAPPDLAVVDTDVSPEDARVYLDGSVIGIADDFDGYPGYLLLEPGTYELEFALPGYEPEKVIVEARGGRFFSLDNRLRRTPGETPPPRYERPPRPAPNQVFGKEAAPPPHGGPDLSLRRDLDLRFRRDRATAREGTHLDIHVEPPEAAVYVDGEFVGTAADVARLQRGLAVSPGLHTIEVFAPGRAPRQVEVEVTEGATQQVVIELDGETEKEP